MSSDLVLAGPASVEALRSVALEAEDYIRSARARNTQRAYRSDWSAFCSWCDSRALPSRPAQPETVALYLADQAKTLSVATLERRLSAIAQAHRSARLDSPTRSGLVRDVLAGIRRRHRTEQVGAAPLLLEDLRIMLGAIPDDQAGLRDRALLLVGFAGAFRRSELVALDVVDLEFRRAGLVVHLRRSKTDQGGAGQQKGIPHGAHPETCPVRALRAWLQAAGIQEGPVFRRVHRGGRVGTARLCDRAVAQIIQRRASAAGLDPERLSGHSLRAGLATQAAADGVEEREIMAQTGHRSVQMVRRYIRDGQLFRGNAAGRVGL